MITDLSLPFKTLDLSGQTSSWFSAFNPLILSGQRKDYEVKDVKDAGSGNTLVTLTGPISGFAVNEGDFVYLKSETHYDSIGKILSTNGTDEFTLDVPYSVDDVNGFMNFNDGLKEYRIRVTLNRLNPVSALYEEIGTGFFSVSPKGVLKADISRYAKNSVMIKDDFQFDAENQKDTNVSAIVTIQIEEQFLQKASETIDETIGFNVVCSAMQSMNTGGSNLKRFVSEITGTDKAEFLTDFQRPTYFEGYPFCLSFIYPSLLVAELYPKRFERVYSGSGQIQTNDVLLDKNQIYYVNRTILSGSFPSDSKYLTVEIGSDGNGNTTRFTGLDFVDEDYVDPQGVSSGTEKTFTKAITIDIEKCIPKSPIYIRWFNLKGGWNYWLFSKSQIFDPVISSGQEFNSFKEDIELQFDTGKVIGKMSSSEMTVFAFGIPSNKFLGLSSIVNSVEIQLYTGYKDGIGHTWMTLRMTKFKAPFDSYNRKHNLELTFRILDNNSQTQ